MAVAAPALAYEKSYLDGGLIEWLTTTDHKKIAVLYGLTGLVFLFIGGMEALVMRLQLVHANNNLISAEWYNQLFTMHGTTMIFLVVMPLGINFFTIFVVPLQIGARDVAFPRINAFTYWLFLMGGILLNSSFAIAAAPDVGWFGYANLTERAFSPGVNVDFWAVALLILGISTLVNAINMFVTVVNMRAPGMMFMRLPLFTWSILVALVLILVAFPPLTVGLVFLLLDRWIGTHFYQAVAGASPLLWQHLFWLFGHPEVYIMALPAFGIISEVIPVFSHKPLFGYPVMVYSTILIGFLSYGVWAHHMFAVGMGPVADTAFMTTSMLIAVPTGIKIFSWIATSWGGRLRFNTAFILAMAFLIQFTMGGLSGVMHATTPIDLQQTDTYFVVAHLHYVLLGGSFFALLSGLYYWWPKLTGRMLSEGMGKISALLTIVGFNVTFFPMHILGAEGMPRRIYTYAPGMGWDRLNLVATIGAFILASGLTLTLFNIVRSLLRGEAAESDPWDGRTLEWTIPSPPSEINFTQVPVVRARDPFWVFKYGVGAEPRPVLPEPGGRRVRADAGGPALTYLPPDQYEAPPPSAYPILLAFSILLFAVGLMVWLRLVFFSLALIVATLIGMGFEHEAYGEPARNQPGLMPGRVDNRQLGMWTFVGSESIFFACLIATYIIYKGRSAGGASAGEMIDLWHTGAATFVLLGSSVTMALSTVAHRQERTRRSQFWLAVTILCGVAFLGNEVYEFTDAAQRGLNIWTNLFGTTYYTLVGFHGLHVTVGVLWLSVLLAASLAKGLPPSRPIALECGAVYWHFVDLVWVVIFVVVYIFKGVAPG